MTSEQTILKELKEISEAQKVLSERATELVNQLGGVSTPSKPNSIKVGVEVVAGVLGRRRAAAFRSR